MLEHLTIEQFEPLIGDTFWVEFPNDTKVELRLVSALKTMESEAARLPRHPFSLTFIGPKSYQLKQRIYKVTHERLGAHEIFLVPIGEQPETYLYEAAFA
ncbi:MAG TPA: hypothetical protein VF911_16300 [Thermoanaerobaculia bacterium]|jgi:hypothetical protein